MTTLPSVFGDLFATGPADEDLRDRIRQFIIDNIDAQDRDSGYLTLQQSKEIVNDLPKLDEAQVDSLGHRDSVCPICLTSLAALLSEEENAIAMDSPAHPIEDLGVTRLSQSWQCGHVFCRRDLRRWIMDGHPSCPMCRRPFIEQSSVDTAQPIHPQDEAQLDASILDLIQRERLENVGQSHPNFTATDADRNEYAGMYS